MKTILVMAVNFVKSAVLVYCIRNRYTFAVAPKKYLVKYQIKR